MKLQENITNQNTMKKQSIKLKRLLFKAYMQGKRDQIYWPSRWEDYTSIGRYRVMKQFLSWYNSISATPIPWTYSGALPTNIKGLLFDNQTLKNQQKSLRKKKPQKKLRKEASEKKQKKKSQNN